MKLFTLLVPISGLLVLLSLEAGASGNVVYQKRVMHGVGVHVVTANLNSPSVKITPAIAARGIGRSEGFGSMLSRLQPTAAITGTFFDVRRLLPVGDIVINGRLVHFGPVGTGLCVTDDNKVEFKPTPYAHHVDWSGYTSVLCSGPYLIKNGAIDIDLKGEHFRAPTFFRTSQRTAVGLTANNKLLLVAVKRPIRIQKLAAILKDLGAVNAIQLDGGSSTAMSYRGRVLSHPGRKLTNLLLVYDSEERYAQVRSRLAPSSLVADSTTPANG